MAEERTEERFVPVARVDDLAPGEVVVVEMAGRSLCLGRTEDGRFGAIDNVCSHDGGTLGEGELDGESVECPRHGGRFDLFSGEVRALPPVIPVTSYPVRVVDGKVEVDLSVEPVREE